jgi:hypothetical protein
VFLLSLDPKTLTVIRPAATPTATMPTTVSIPARLRSKALTTGPVRVTS